MVERVIVQSQREYAEMNRAFIKGVFFIGTFIIGILILMGEFDFAFSHVPRWYGILFLLPMIIWLSFKIKKKIDKSRNHSYSNRYSRRDSFHPHHKSHQHHRHSRR